MAPIGIAESDGFTFHTQINKLDWVVFNVALFATMFAGVDIGLGVSIGLSIVLALWKSAFPRPLCWASYPRPLSTGDLPDMKYRELVQTDSLVLAGPGGA